MAMSSSSAEILRPSPERVFNALNAYQETAALKTAIELDIFTVIAKGSNDAEALATETGASERGMRILCDFLTIQGFLVKSGNRYGLTKESAIFLDRRSPACLASISEFLGSEQHKQCFDFLTAAVRKGGTAGSTGDNTRPNDEFWVRFAHAMAPLTIPTAQFIAELVLADGHRACKVLDVAAGHGMYGVTIAENNPQAEIVASRPRSGKGKRQKAWRCRTLSHATGQRVRGGSRQRLRLRAAHRHISPLRYAGV